MKKYFILPVVLISIIFLFSACTENGTEETTKNDLPISDEQTGENTTNAENTEASQNMSYEEYFSEKRSFQTVSPFKGTVRTDDITWLNESREISIGETFSDISVFSHLSGTLNNSKLYFVNYVDYTAEEFSEYEISQNNAWGETFNITNNGVYAVINKSELVFFNRTGELEKVLFKAKNGNIIKDFTVSEPLAWVFDGDSIYRIFIPDLTTDKLYSDIEEEDFCTFLSPISNFEISWREYATDFWNLATEVGFSRNTKTDIEKIDAFDNFIYSHMDLPMFVAHYYDTASKNKIQREIYYNNAIKTIGMGWWFVPENAYEVFQNYKIEIPEELYGGAFDYDITCGIGQYYTDTQQLNLGNPVAFTAISYDMSSEFNNDKLININIPDETFSISSFELVSDNMLIAKGTYDSIMMCGTWNYNFAFYCSDENSPVYCFAIRADLFDNSVFENIYKTIGEKNS